MAYGRFDPYFADRERKLIERAKEHKQFMQWREDHGKLVRDKGVQIRTRQTLCKKKPVTLPKLSFQKDA